jgi:hypothetical protein
MEFKNFWKHCDSYAKDEIQKTNDHEKKDNPDEYQERMRDNETGKGFHILLHRRSKRRAQR